jgi:peroxiredoxin
LELSSDISRTLKPHMMTKYAKLPRRLALIAALVGLIAGLWGCSIENAPLPPQTGSILVTARDPNGFDLIGGQIWLDGISQGGKLTPDTVITTVGVHNVLVTKAGFSSIPQPVTIAANTLVPLAFTLTPLTVGSLQVSAMDTVNSVALSSAVIFLDGNPTGLIAPDTLNGLAVGDHIIGAGQPGYLYRENTFQVAAADTNAAVINTASANWNGVKVTATFDSALICVDDQLLSLTTPGILTGLPDGAHLFSCYKSNCATLNPNLQRAYTLTLGPQELTYQLAFNLEPWVAGVGHSVGQLASGFTLQSDFLDSVSLGAYRGHVVLLTFWFRNCVPCMNEMPEIQEAYEDLSTQGFRVLGINYMAPDNLQTLQQVRQDLGITFEFLMDFGYVVTAQYGTTQFPTNVLIDQRGVVSWYTGSLTYQSLTDHVLALLNP